MLRTMYRMCDGMCKGCEPLVATTLGGLAYQAAVSAKELFGAIATARVQYNCCVTARSNMGSDALLLNVAVGGQCQAQLQDAEGFDSLCRARNQSIGLFMHGVHGGTVAVYLCSGHFKDATEHRFCVCGYFPLSPSQSNFSRCLRGHQYHLECCERERLCPHDPCRAARSVYQEPSMERGESSDQDSRLYAGHRLHGQRLFFRRNLTQ